MQTHPISPDRALNSLCIAKRSEMEKRPPAETTEVGQSALELRHSLEIADLKDALRQAEDKYRVLVENANDAILVLQDGRIRFANPKALELGGVLAEDLDKVPFHEYLHPSEKDAIVERHEQRLKGEKILNMYPLRIVTRQGEVFWGEVNAVRFEWEGQPATLNIIRDITSQKLIEQHYLQTESLATLRTLSGGMAHSINNLLMGIQGRVSLLHRIMDSEDAGSDHLDAIEACVDEAAVLTRQMLGFAQTGKYKVTRVDMNDVIGQIAESLWRSLPQNTLVWKRQADLWHANADLQQIEQVINNVVLNALQALTEEGTLTIKSENFELSEGREILQSARAGRWIKLVFRDTGCGMDDTVRKRVFEPFFTTKGFGRHRGLGLSCAYGIIANHDGMIDVDSAPGAGTTVSIYLPAAEPD
jgi:two-component system, cell cycle sensor histidine kinase and response regulator CckA